MRFAYLLLMSTISLIHGCRASTSTSNSSSSIILPADGLKEEAILRNELKSLIALRKQNRCSVTLEEIKKKLGVLISKNADPRVPLDTSKIREFFNKEKNNRDVLSDEMISTFVGRYFLADMDFDDPAEIWHSRLVDSSWYSVTSADFNAHETLNLHKNRRGTYTRLVKRDGVFTPWRSAISNWDVSHSIKTKQLTLKYTVENPPHESSGPTKKTVSRTLTYHCDDNLCDFVLKTTGEHRQYFRNPVQSIHFTSVNLHECSPRLFKIKRRHIN